MKVLMQGRSRRSLDATPGGDQVQLEQTASTLAKDFGVDTCVSADLEPDLSDFDLVHLFGLVRPQEVWVQATNAHKQGKPCVLSTVYCDVWEFERYGRGGAVGWLARHSNRDVIEALKAGGRSLRSREWNQGSRSLFLRGFTAMQREIMSLASVFLPNSRSEWARLVSDLQVHISDDRVVVVPNAASAMPDPTTIQPSARVPAANRFPAGCVASVARLEGRKNQLNLIAAVQGTEFALLLAGKPAANQRRYVKEVLTAASRASNVFVLGQVSEAEKWSILRSADVHALPSWMETTGLSSLEASAMGCALVVSPNGDTREYFEDDAEYCDPSDPGSIRSALFRAAKKGASSKLAERSAKFFTWSQAAERTLAGYELALKLRGNSRA